MSDYSDSLIKLLCSKIRNYPKFNVKNLDSSINSYIEMYIFELKKIQKKYPNNIKVFFSDELDSEYGKKKVMSFLRSTS